MFIVPADYFGLKKKNVEGMIFERDEEGFFERVVSVHPLGLENKRTDFNPVHVLYEVHLKLRSSTGLRSILDTLMLPFFLIHLIWNLVEITKYERVNLIRANDPYWMGFLGLIVKKITRLPLCVSIHSNSDQLYKLKGPGNSYTFFGFKYPAVLLSRLVMCHADMVLPIRESLAEWAKKNGANPDSIRVIPHGVDFSKYNQIDKLGDWLPDHAKDKQIIGFVGRLSKENYVHQLPEIIEKLSNKRDDFIFVIAGGGELGPMLESAMADSPLLSKHMRLLGFQTQEKCFDLQGKSALCLCLMGGYSLIEACAASSPVISYNVEWHYELVINDRTGFLIDENDMDKVTEAIDLLLSNQRLATQMGKNAAKLVREKHDIHLTSKIKRSCYCELLQQK